MNSSKFLTKNLVIIFLLGISSGLPLALILSTLKALLVDRGFDIKTIGFFSLISLPYTLKFCFAPIMDSIGLPILTKIFGQRRSWMVLSQLFLIIFIAALGTAAIFGSLGTIAVLALLIAFASASQDIVIDAYRIELIEKENQGLAAGFYVYGYRIGMLISGAGALILADLIGWKAVYFFMAVFMLIGIITTIFAKDVERDWKQEKYDFFSWFKNSVIKPFQDFTAHQKWPAIIAFIICFKLGDAFAGNLTLPFLLELDFTKLEIASVVKTFGLFATLSGVFVGGVLVKKLNLNKSLWIAGFAQMISNLAFSHLSQIGHNVEVLYFVIFIENFSCGIGDAVFVAYLSGLCNIKFSATQYALLSSLATLSRSVLSSSAGIFVVSLGWYNFYIFSTFLAIPGLIFLYLIRNK